MFDFPAGPVENQEFTPPGGPAYVFKTPRWMTKGGAATFIGDSPPTGPTPGQLWWDSDSGRLYIYYDDGNTQQWVEATAAGVDLTGYVRETSGLWTPFIYGSTVAGVGTYSSQIGRWTRQGRMVFLEGNATWSAHTGTGNMFMAGLPYTSVGNPSAIATVYGNGLTFSGQLTGYVSAAVGTGIGVQTFATGGAATGLAMDTAANLQVNCVYATNDP